jgi:hypothetical protein
MPGRAIALRLEDAAWNFLRAHHLLHVWNPTALLILRAAGVRICEDVLTSFRAYSDLDRWEAHVPPEDLSPSLFEQSLAHEAGHFILELDGIPRDLQDGLIPNLTPRWQMPKDAVLQVCTEAGLFSPPHLIAAFPHYPPAEVLLRAAQVTDVVVVVFPARGRIRRASSLYRPIRFRLEAEDERDMIEAAIHSRTPVLGYGGCLAWRFDHEGLANVAIVYEPRGFALVG